MASIYARAFAARGDAGNCLLKNPRVWNIPGCMKLCICGLSRMPLAGMMG